MLFTESPKVTIITVVFNAASTIDFCIKSVLNQTYENIQFLIIDGGSTDGTLEIICGHQHRIDYFLSEPDNGIYHAMNKGVKVAKGEFIYFLGADDVLYNNHVVSDAVKFFKSKNQIYYGDVKFLSRKKLYDGKFNSLKLVTRNISHQSIFYPTAVFRLYSYNQEYRVFADYVLNLSLYNCKTFSFKYIPLIIAVFNDKGISGLNSTSDLKFDQDRLTIIKKNFPFWAYYYRVVRSKLAIYIKSKK